MSLLYISEGRLYRLKDQKPHEITSTVLDEYKIHVHNRAMRNEWKTSGSGARFTGSYVESDSESAVDKIRSRMDCSAVFDGNIVYSQTIDGSGGIYTKRENAPDGTVFCDGKHIFRDFSITYDGYMTASAQHGRRSHICEMHYDVPGITFLTEGDCIDRYPSYSKTEPHIIYYSSAGITVSEYDEDTRRAPMGYEAMINEMYSEKDTLKGPSSICRLDTRAGEVTEILCDNKYDYIKPLQDSDGNLYYIRKPYASKKGSTSAAGILLDILLFPFRLIKAILSFLNVFSLKYSGKSLKSGSSVAKRRDEKEIFIDGNLIDAEKAMKESERAGDKTPGIIPQSYMLMRLSKDGREEIIKKGVIAFTLGPDCIYYSNGKAIFREKNGHSEKVCDAEKATYIYSDEN